MTHGDKPFSTAMNENHYPPLPQVHQAICAAAKEVNRYPDMFGTELSGIIGDFLDVPAKNIVVGPGSAAVCLQFLRLYCRSREVIYPWPSFEGYPLLIRYSGATGVPVPLRDSGHDLAAMADAVNDQTGLVVLCNPNNPTGTVLDSGELARFIENLPAGLLVVIDEAYHDFARPGVTTSAIELHRRHPDKVCVLRTFSKAYGLAGLRVGFLVAGDAVASQLSSQIPFLGVNSLGQVGAIAGLQAQQELRDRCAAIRAERDAMRSSLLDQGWQVPPSEANFLWLPAGSSATRFAEFCEGNGTLIRAFPDLGVRVTVSEPAANNHFVRLAAKFRDLGPP